MASFRFCIPLHVVRRTAFALLCTFYAAHSAQAQLPAEVFAGHRATDFNFMWFKDLDKKAKISLFNFTFFSVDYKDKTRNTSEIYQVGTYNLTEKWGIAAGGRYVKTEFIPQVAVSYQVTTKYLYINLFPAVQYSFQSKAWLYSMFSLAFYEPPINNKWKFYSMLILEPTFSGQQHLFSYQQIRVGLTWDKNFQFGLGLNLDQVGVRFKNTTNAGVFIRKEL